MFRAFFKSREHAFYAYGIGLLLIFSLITQTWIAVVLNGVFGETIDILTRTQEHTQPEFWQQMGWWVGLSILNDFCLVVPTSLLNRRYAIKWRTVIHRYYEIAWHQTPQKLGGASQRVEEDIQSFASTVISLGLGLLSAVTTLIGFLPILWRLGNGLAVPFLPLVPGLLVWVILVICIGGTCISWLVGIKLPEIENQKRNANATLREKLVLTEDSAIFSGRMRATPFDHILEVIKAQHRYFWHITAFEAWITVYALVLEILPNCVGADALFAGTITYGVITKIIDAFGNARMSFSFFIDNWQTITVLKAVYRRLVELEVNLGLRTSKK